LAETDKDIIDFVSDGEKERVEQILLDGEVSVNFQDADGRTLDAPSLFVVSKLMLSLISADHFTSLLTEGISTSSSFCAIVSRLIVR
jgi:hypothetical protein